MNQEKNGKATQKSACDLKHRIRADGPGDGPSGYFCCDSRQCLFKVEFDGRNYCLLERSDGDGA
jgi:hypothetical protein